MNSGKRLFTLLLAMVMLVTLAAGTISAYAEENVPQELIDASRNNCSITVTKYSSMKTNPAKTDATGKVDTVPSDQGYELLPNITFYLYKVVEAQGVIDYYDGATEGEFYTVDTFLAGSSKTYSDDPNVFSVKDIDGNLVVNPTEAITGTGENGTQKGVAVFSELDVGMYVLVEAKVSLNVTSLSEATLISVPMVNTASSTNTPEGENSKWLYDVYVYPKNITRKGTVEITKTGNNSPLSNVTFVLQKQVSPAEGGTAWETVKKDGSDQTAKTGSDGIAMFDNLDAGTYRVFERSNENPGYIIDRTPIEFTVNTDNTISCTSGMKNLTLSYIGLDKQTHDLVDGKTDTYAYLKIALDNEKPSITKTVQENGGTEYKPYAQYSIGDTIPYRITVAVPNNIVVWKNENISLAEAQRKKFLITDTPINLQDTPPTKCTYEEGTTKELSLENKAVQSDNGFSLDLLELSPESLNKIAGKTITIDYTAVLQGNAAIADKGNVNTATLTYSHYVQNPENIQDTDPVQSIDDAAVVYTYQYIINKKLLESATEKKPGANVQFELYENGQKISVKSLSRMSTESVPEELGGLYRKALSDETDAITTLTTGKDGKLIIQGLEKGSYQLKEIRTVQGYNLLSDLLTIELAVIDEDLNPQKSSDTRDVYYKENNAYVGAESHFVESTNTTDVINKKGFVLPQTGSMGYLVFCAAGITLVAAGALILFGGRKKKIR